MFATFSVLLVLTTRAMSIDCGGNKTNDSGGCGGDGGNTSVVSDDKTPPPTSDSPPPAPPPVMPQPFAPGGGTGGTIGSLPTLANGLTALGASPSLAAAGAFLAWSGGATVAVQAPYKLVVSSYSWIVNGEVVFGGNLFQQGPTLYFNFLELKLASIKYGGPILIIFNDINGAPAAAVDVMKQF